MTKAIINRKVTKNGRLFLADRHLFTNEDYAFMASHQGNMVLVTTEAENAMIGLFHDIDSAIAELGEEIFCSAREERDYNTLIYRV